MRPGIWTRPSLKTRHVDDMSFAAAPYDAHTTGVMAAALETAWMAARLGVPNMPDDARAKLEEAILDAVACGQRDFTRLQQAAFDAVGATAVKPVSTPAPSGGRHGPKAKVSSA